MRDRKRISFITAVILLLQFIMLPILEADTSSYYQLVSPKGYKIKSNYQLTNTGKNDALSATIQVIVGGISDSPYHQNIDYKVTPSPKYIYADSSGNIYAEIYMDKIKAGAAVPITVEKTVVNGGISYSSSVYKMGADYSEFMKDKNNHQYVEAGDKVEADAPEIRAKAAEFAGQKGLLTITKSIYDFVNLNLTYDNSAEYANKGALSAINTRRGVCEEYASLFTALCRAAGIPARVVTGHWIKSSLKQNIWNNVSSDAHAWAEFYLPEVGWIPVEPTFLYTYNGVRTPNKNHFANINADQIHLLNSYQPNTIMNHINVRYLVRSETHIEAKIGDTLVMPIGSKPVVDVFADISSSWARAYINKLYNQGILFAKQNGLYKPSDNITRAEFAAYLVNALRLKPKDSRLSLKDIREDSDYVSFIQTAVAYGLITGNNQGYFMPNSPITRQDAATILERALELRGINQEASAELQFADANLVSSYAKEAVSLVYSLKIMTGKPGNMFEPRSYTTRAEAAKLLDNFINATE